MSCLKKKKGRKERRKEGESEEGKAGGRRKEGKAFVFVQFCNI